MNGPCIYCGNINYAPSMGGPMVCPSCDCGNFGPAVVKQQGDTIIALRAALEKSCIDGRFEDIDAGCLRAVRAESRLAETIKVLGMFARAYEQQDADNFNNSMRAAYDYYTKRARVMALSPADQADPNIR